MAKFCETRALKKGPLGKWPSKKFHFVLFVFDDVLFMSYDGKLFFLIFAYIFLTTD